MDRWWGQKGLQIQGRGNGLSQETPARKQKRPGVGAGQGLAWVRSCWQPLHSSNPHRKPWWVPHYLAELLGKARPDPGMLWGVNAITSTWHIAAGH